MPRTDRLRPSQIEPNDYNPNHMKPDQRKALARMMRQYGYLQPILVRPLSQEFPGDPDARYEIVDGEHRFDALKESGAAEIEAVILDAEIEAADAKLLTLTMNALKGKPIPLKQAEVILDVQRELGKETLIEAGFTEGDLEKAHELAGPVGELSEPEPLEEPQDFKVRLTPDQMETLKRALGAAKVVAQSDRDDVAITALAAEFLATYPEADPATNGG